MVWKRCNGIPSRHEKRSDFVLFVASRISSGMVPLGISPPIRPKLRTDLRGPLSQCLSGAMTSAIAECGRKTPAVRTSSPGRLKRPQMTFRHSVRCGSLVEPPPVRCALFHMRPRATRPTLSPSPSSAPPRRNCHRRGCRSPPLPPHRRKPCASVRQSGCACSRRRASVSTARRSPNPTGREAGDGAGNRPASGLRAHGHHDVLGDAVAPARADPHLRRWF